MNSLIANVPPNRAVFYRANEATLNSVAVSTTTLKSNTALNHLSKAVTKIDDFNDIDSTMEEVVVE